MEIRIVKSKGKVLHISEEFNKHAKTFCGVEVKKDTKKPLEDFISSKNRCYKCKELYKESIMTWEDV